MAIDTKEKRLSVIGMSVPAPLVNPYPVGAINTPGRYHFLSQYYHDPADLTPGFIVSGDVNVRILAEAGVVL